jgi:hypothetical protein
MDRIGGTFKATAARRNTARPPLTRAIDGSAEWR